MIGRRPNCEQLVKFDWSRARAFSGKCPHCRRELIPDYTKCIDGMNVYLFAFTECDCGARLAIKDLRQWGVVLSTASCSVTATTFNISGTYASGTGNYYG